MSPRRRPRIVSWIWRANAGDADLVHDVTESRRLERSCRFVSSLLSNDDDLRAAHFSTDAVGGEGWLVRVTDDCKEPWTTNLDNATIFFFSTGLLQCKKNISWTIVNRGIKYVLFCCEYFNLAQGKIMCNFDLNTCVPRSTGSHLTGYHPRHAGKMVKLLSSELIHRLKC